MTFNEILRQVHRQLPAFLVARLPPELAANTPQDLAAQLTAEPMGLAAVLVHATAEIVRNAMLNERLAEQASYAELATRAKSIDYAMQPTLSAVELAQHIHVLADAAELGKRPAVGAALRALAGGHLPYGLTADEVLIRNGLNPTYSQEHVGDERRSGRTTRMLAEVVALWSREVFTEITGHDRKYTHTLLQQAVHMAQVAGLPPTLTDRMAKTQEQRLQAYREPHPELVDHYRRY